MKDHINKSKQWQEEQALARFQIIAPLLQPGLDEAKKVHLRKKIAEDNGISLRSVYRYEKSYNEGSFSGLKPMNREKRRLQKLPENFDFLLQQAIQLRREVPERSVHQIISILELEGHVEPGALKRSTLERYLFNAGFGSQHLKIYKEARQSSSRRFCKPHRMMLIQADIKYGPKLPIGKGGKKVQTYLSSAIDDHSRFLLHSRFYASQDESVITDTFHKAILKYGVFDCCYFDNGKQYLAKQLKFSLARLGCRVRHTPPRSGRSKGKVEKFHQVVDRFNREAKLKDITTLDKLNYYWDIYLNEYYHKQAHEGIKEYYEYLGVSVPPEGITPIQEWNRDSRPLKYLDVSVVSEAFLHHENRKVNQGGCISFQGKQYETKPELIGFTVEISYDPASPETLTVHYPGIEPFTARPLEIREFCGERDPLPVSMKECNASTSRLLDVLEKKHDSSQELTADAISFASFRKEISEDV